MKTINQKPSEAETSEMEMSEVGDETKSQRPLFQKPPVVVVLGHVDSGKTSILNTIRKLQFTGEKPGGAITQHIGAYQIKKDSKEITFIDTPGHEAFSAMRSRGAKVADIAILVIDAAEGVQPQTREALSHIKKAQIPFIVVLNKIDKPEANSEKVKRELQKEEILVEDLGGKIPAIEVSAKTGQGIDELLELISLVAEMENLRADIQKPGEGVVIESYLDSQRGPTATLILNQGILKIADIVGTPTTLGKVKILENFQGKSVEKILPADPAIVIGFEAVPKVGENFKVFPDYESARKHLEVKKKKEVPAVLEIRSEQKVLNLILKADVLGSIEAIEEVLKELPQEKVILRILKSEVGEINESDIKLARSGRAVILGFRVKSNLAAKQLAKREKIKIMNFEIIYDLVEGVRNFMEKIVTPTVVREELGKVKVLAIFLTEKNRQIVGGKVIEGEVRKGAQIKVFKGEELVGQGKLINLQKNKKDIEKIGKGEECGILFEGDTRIEEGDILVVYTEERRRGEL
ncbi:MAG: translation initiation factor IF-2 [Patescibacteria group bacterium]|nr:translation initiation factor IF-2 [Patescibacteria group bacterium]